MRESDRSIFGNQGSAQEDDAVLWSVELDSSESITQSLQINCYGEPKRVPVIGQGTASFVATGRRDHLAGGYFDAGLFDSGRTLVVQLDWPSRWGKRATILLQTEDFQEVARIEDQKQPPREVTVPRPSDGYPERLRVVLLFSEASVFTLPRSIRVSSKRAPQSPPR